MDVLSHARLYPLLFDGGMGSELMRRGLSPGECPEQWTRTHPRIVEEIHRAYYAAGADIVNSNSFGGSRLRLDAYGLGTEAVALNREAAELAVGLRDREYRGRLVAGNIGSSGRLLAPLGDADPGEVYRAYAEQVEGLLLGGVDLINIETMFDLAEAQLAVTAAVGAAAGGVPVFVSLAFARSAKGYRTMMGVDPASAVSTLREAGASLVGCNCEITAEQMADLVPLLADLNGGLTCAEPNAGQPRLEGEATVYDETPEHFAAIVAGFVSSGARFVGGCCGTTPAHIAALVAALSP